MKVVQLGTTLDSAKLESRNLSENESRMPETVYLSPPKTNWKFQNENSSILAVYGAVTLNNK